MLSVSIKAANLHLHLQVMTSKLCPNLAVTAEGSLRAPFCSMAVHAQLAPCLWQELLLALLGFPGDIFQASYTDNRPTLRLAEDLHWIGAADRWSPCPFFAA